MRSSTSTTGLAPGSHFSTTWGVRPGTIYDLVRSAAMRTRLPSIYNNDYGWEAKSWACHQLKAFPLTKKYDFDSKQ